MSSPRARAAEATVAGTHLRDGRTAEEMADLAGEIGADLAVVGSRGLGTVRRLATGSVSEGVAPLAPCPVLVMRAHAAWPPREAVVGDDSSEESRVAGELAARLARPYDVPVLLLRAYHPQRLLKSVRAASHDTGAADARLEAGEEQLRERAAELEGVLGKTPTVKAVAGDAAAALQREAEGRGGGTLVAVGSTGAGAVKRFALGSVSADVLRAVDGPVLVCPSPEVAR